MKKNTKYILLFLILIVLVAGIVIYFKTNTYYVNFYSEGTLIERIETRKNRAIKEPTSPTKEGYMFIGWYDQNGELFDFNNNITKDINLNAGWGKITMNEE